MVYPTHLAPGVLNHGYLRNMRPAHPPYHACPECGAPHPTREDKADYNERWKQHFYTCAHCKELCAEDYTVTDEVWMAAGMHYHGGVLHLACIERRIGRQLELADFKDIPMNSMIRYFWARLTSASC